MYVLCLHVGMELPAEHRHGHALRAALSRQWALMLGRSAGWAPYQDADEMLSLARCKEAVEFALLSSGS